MELARLVICLGDLVPDFENIDGFLFYRRMGETTEEVRKKILGYESLREAQSWINIVLIDSFIDEVAGGDWSIDDPSIDEILNIYERAWASRFASCYPRERYKIERIVDPDLGDVGLRLTQELS